MGRAYPNTTRFRRIYMWIWWILGAILVVVWIVLAIAVLTAPINDCDLM